MGKKYQYQKRLPYLTDSERLVQDGFGVGVIVWARQHGSAEVRLQQQMGLGVRAVEGMRIGLKRKTFGQLTVHMIFIVSYWQICVFFCILRKKKKKAHRK